MTKRTWLVAAIVVLGGLALGAIYAPDSMKPLSWRVAGVVRQLESATTFEIPDNLRRSEAVRELVAIGEPAVEPLIALLKTSPPAPVRVGVMDALGKIGDHRAFGLLAVDVRHRDRTIRQTAIAALGSMPGKDVDSVLLTALAADDRFTTLEAARALGPRRDARAVPRLAALYDRAQEPMDKKTYAEALAKIGGEDAVGLLAQRLATEASPFVRSEVATLIGSVDDPRVADALRRSTSHLEVVAAAYLFFLRTPGLVDDDVIVGAFHRYGGSGMSKALLQSGKPAFVKAVRDEGANPRPKTIEVK